MERTRLPIIPTVVAATWLLMPGCKGKPEDPAQTAEAELIDSLRLRFVALVSVDQQDGHDNFDEQELFKRRKIFLEQLKQNDPKKYRQFLLQFKSILKKRRPVENDEDIELELMALDPEILLARFQNRSEHTAADGTVRFSSKKAEKKLGLGDLTPDDVIMFQASEQTLKKMGITATQPFECYRTKKATQARIGEKTIAIPAGSFVVKTKEGIEYKVLVFNGDRIIDSVTRELNPENASPSAAPLEFENFITTVDRALALPTARNFFHGYFSSYRKILIEEYEDLLVKDGISIEKHFAYFIQWSRETKIPPSEESIRRFFHDLLEEKPEKESAEPGALEKILKKARDFMQSGEDENERLHSAADRRRKESGDEAEILKKRFGPLFGIVRLHGISFDQYTYNRLTGNYAAKVSAVSVPGKGTYLSVEDILEDIVNAPNDIIHKVAERNSFAERLKRTATYRSTNDNELRADLAFSEGHISGEETSPADFSATYDANGSVSAIFHRGKPYEPAKFIAPPERLREIPGNQVTLDLGGGVVFNLNLQDYFAYYRKLEEVRAGMSQELMYFDSDEEQTVTVRNPAWFVEEDASHYRHVAEAVTAAYGTPHEKLLALGNWLQRYFDYIDEPNTEINKLAVATFMDHGGDCDDSFTAFKTLAHALGLGEYVGGVFFKGHVAPMIKGKLGKTVYRIDGEDWTIFELSTPLGKTVNPGETPNKKPVYFIMPDGSIKSAATNVIPVHLVAIDELDGRLVAELRAKMSDTEKFLADENNRPSLEKLEQAEELTKALDEKLEQVRKAYLEIVKGGKISQSIVEGIKELTARTNAHAAQWEKIVQDQHDALRKLDLKNAPAEFAKALQEFTTLAKVITDNFDPTLKAMKAELPSYSGRENDYDAMLALHNRLVELLNQSRIYVSCQEMQVIFNDTLQHLPAKFKPPIEQLLKVNIQQVEWLLKPINKTREILQQLEE